MKSVEEIDRRLEEVKQAPNSLERTTTIDYLQLAKECAEEHWLHHLVNKYSYEMTEDKYIVETLKWILEDK